MSRLPVKRAATEFLVEHVEHEVLVYDQVHHRAHCLTPAAALVWSHCDGSPGSLARATASLAAAGHGEHVTAIVEQLRATGLVHAAVERIDNRRRRFLGKTAVAAGVVLASPVIYSIISPSVAEAASVCGAKAQLCCTKAPACHAGLRCLSGRCN